MAETKKTKAQIRAERVRNINKARKKMIDAKIAEAEAENIQKIADVTSQAEAERQARQHAELKHQKKSEENAQLKEKLEDKRRATQLANARAARARNRAAEEKHAKETVREWHHKRVAENEQLKGKLAERKKETQLAKAKAERARDRAEEERRIKENAQYYHHKKVAENVQLKAELRTRKKAAGAQKMALSAICLGIGAVVFALLYVILFACFQNNWAGNDNKQIEIAYVVFYCLADAAIIGLLTLAIPIFSTLRKEGHLNKLSILSIIFIWIISVFSFAIYVVTILDKVDTSLIDWKPTENALSYLATALTLVLLAFSVVLYISVKRSYKQVYNR